MISPRAQAQGVVDKTSLGKSQNDDRDLVNSLIPGQEKFGHGEKKTQVSAAELKSKSIKDSTFGGSLLNMGIDPSEPKIDASKLRSSPATTDNTATDSKKHAASNQNQSAVGPGDSAVPNPAATEKAPEAVAGHAQDDQTFSNLSMTATLGDALVQEDKAAAEAKSAGDNRNKTQNAAGAGDKNSSAASSDKSTDPKPNGDH